MNHFPPSLIPELPAVLHLGWSPVYENLSEAILSISDQKELSSMSSAHRKNEFLSVRHLFNGMAEELNLEERATDLKKNELGKPVLESSDPPGLSFSHSRKMVVVALSTGHKQVGVDLESLGRRIHSGLKDRLLSPQEQKSCSQYPVSLLWAMKEAAVKCTGTGLRLDLHKLELSVRDQNRFSVRFSADNTILSGYYAEWEDHVLTIVTGEPV